jgi:hypothetical protein
VKAVLAAVEDFVMRTAFIRTALLFVLVSVPMTGASGQSLSPGETMVRGSSPVTFKVAVKVANLMPDVAHIRVHCILHQGTVQIAHGYTTTQISSSGNFDSTVTVPVNILYPNQTEVKISQANSYNCSLQLLNNADPPQVWPPDKTNAPVWAQPKAGSIFAKSIGGKFPPKP